MDNPSLALKMQNQKSVCEEISGLLIQDKIFKQ
jgi:hypothetical protein